jgi:superfamily II DNA or RNA helicase
MSSRTIPRQLRHVLWLAADGCCQTCGAPVNVDDFEIDHRNPWVLSHNSASENLAVACFKCNRGKGMKVWRQHQKNAVTIAQLMQTSAIREVICNVTPGGGKSALPIIFGRYLLPSRAAKIGWLTPRDNLRDQGELNFGDTKFRTLLGHSLEIRATVAEADPCRGTAGFITTYQAVVADRYCLLKQDFLKHRYVLILDELQHIATGSDWHRALQPLWDLAAFRIIMSGGLQRSDNQPCAFLPYLPPDQDGKSFVDLSDTSERRIINYDMRDALREHAIIPLFFELLDGNAEWERGGTEFSERISEADNGEIGSAIYTTLQTDFAHHLLTKTVEHWLAHRQFNPRALLLVVAPSISLARKYARWLRQMKITKSDIATSEASKAAKDNIEAFKRGKLDALVTVAMAYEGMDVPPITHIACLTHIRARPWIEQMLARATRYDERAGPWEHQHAWIFAPDDKLFQQVMEDMKEIQAPFIEEQKQHTGGPHQKTNADVTTPISSNADAIRAAGLADNEIVLANEHEQINEAMKRAGLFGLATEYQAKRFFEEMAAKPSTDTTTSDDEYVPPSEREQQYSKKIETWINKNFYRGNGEILKTINTALMQWYGKSRQIMTEQELKLVWEQRMMWAAKFGLSDAIE